MKILISRHDPVSVRWHSVNVPRYALDWVVVDVHGDEAVAISDVSAFPTAILSSGRTIRRPMDVAEIIEGDRTDWTDAEFLSWQSDYESIKRLIEAFGTVGHQRQEALTAAPVALTATDGDIYAALQEFVKQTGVQMDRVSEYATAYHGVWTAPAPEPLPET